MCGNEIKKLKDQEINMSRLAQLQEKFLEIPKSIIVKADAMREGIRYTQIMSEVGRWALPQSHWCYDWDHDDLHAKEESSDGWTFTPYSFHLTDNTTVIIQLDQESPYEIRAEGGGRYCLYRDNMPVEEVFFPLRPRWYSQTTSDDKLMSTIAGRPGDCRSLVLIGFNYCEYFKTGEQCRFCSINPTVDRLNELGIEREVYKHPNWIVETYEAAFQEGDPIHTVFFMSGGGIIGSQKETDFYLKIINAIKEKASHKEDIPVVLVSQALEKSDAKRLYDTGMVDTICYPLEVWDERLWPVIVPGKARYVGRERWKRALVEAAEIFGPRHVMSLFVGGVEMAPEEGFKEVDEAVESTLEGMDWLLRQGIFSMFGHWTPSPGSLFAGLEIPPTDYFLKLGLEKYKLTKKYGVEPPFARWCHRCWIGTDYDYLRLGLYQKA
jgi:hypothetical protein